jgi:5-methylcytosine-specific restriction endonuclease McrA
MDITTRAEAKAMGLTRYFTGRPCKHGHVAERMEKNKQCVECNRVNAKKWTSNNKDRSLKKARNYYKNNSEKVKQRARDWRRKNKNKVREMSSSWKERNKNLASEISRAAVQSRRSRLKNSGGSGISHSDIKRMVNEQSSVCVYCGIKSKLTLDHVHPLNLGGLHDVENAVMCCALCNSKKGDKPLLMFLMSINQHSAV